MSIALAGGTATAERDLSRARAGRLALAIQSATRRKAALLPSLWPFPLRQRCTPYTHALLAASSPLFRACCLAFGAGNGLAQSRKEARHGAALR